MAQEEEDAPPPPPPSLAETAAAADLVALVQVADTDYEMVRDFPRGGTAFLRVMIPYKVTRPLTDIIEVYEEGLKDNECYFPTPEVTEEGRRFLVFLRFNPEVEEQYTGMDNGCAIPVLVTTDNQYVLRYPLDGMRVSDDPAADARPMNFRDQYAQFAMDEGDVDERNAWLEAGFVERVDEGYRFTHGLDLSVARRLIGEDNLTRDRQLLRVAEPVIITE